MFLLNSGGGLAVWNFYENESSLSYINGGRGAGPTLTSIIYRLPSGSFQRPLYLIENFWKLNHHNPGRISVGRNSVSVTCFFPRCLFLVLERCEGMAFRHSELRQRDPSTNSYVSQLGNSRPSCIIYSVRLGFTLPRSRISLEGRVTLYPVPDVTNDFRNFLDRKHPGITFGFSRQFVVLSPLIFICSERYHSRKALRTLSFTVPSPIFHSVLPRYICTLRSQFRMLSQ